MKIITLNVWGGHLLDDLLMFFEQHQQIDIFCLQEVYHNAEKMITREERYVCLDVLSQIQRVLPNHVLYFAPVVNDIYGIAILIHKDNVVLEYQVKPIYNNPNYSGIGPDHNRILQRITFSHQNNIYSVLNLHGLWNGKGKTDSDERIEQANATKECIKSCDSAAIICGDFNLRPDTKSLAIVEFGLVNLVTKYNITSTRTSYYPKSEKYADYIIISPEVSCENFAVLPEVVSDHAALYADLTLSPVDSRTNQKCNHHKQA